MADVIGCPAQMQLSIEVGSDPIAGSLSVGDGAPQQFCGWIELVAAIESVRHAAPGGADKTLGSFPGANRGAI
jgi:hypothetical protein